MEIRFQTALTFAAVVLVPAAASAQYEGEAGPLVISDTSVVPGNTVPRAR